MNRRLDRITETDMFMAQEFRARRLDSWFGWIATDLLIAAGLALAVLGALVG